jgi:xyloglucan:xyloglucosyl transferase
MKSGYLSNFLIIFLFLLKQSLSDAAFGLSTVSFTQGFTPLFGEYGNIVQSTDDKSVNLHLNKFSGSGFKSSDMYNNGLFSAKIKLPSDYTAGIVVAFYTSNGDIFEKTHDELDFEFLGNIRGKKWRFQTNLYGNGSTSRGREERYYLWFDPSKDFHQYTILWTPNKIIFFVDNVPIREIIRTDAMSGDYPAKPMSLYATIWDASTWATSGGKYKVNYKYAPFVTQLTDLTLHGCNVNPIEESVDVTTCTINNQNLETITPRQQSAMRKFRQKYMYYSYCYDTWRYPVPPSECTIDSSLRQRFKESGRLKFSDKHKRHSKKRGDGVNIRINYENEDDD